MRHMDNVMQESPDAYADTNRAKQNLGEKGVGGGVRGEDSDGGVTELRPLR
jgi:hypothetical protein